MHCSVVVEHVASRVTRNRAATVRITGFMRLIPFLTLISMCFPYGLIQEGWFCFKHNSVHGLATEGQCPSGFQICLFQLDLSPSNCVCLQILLPNSNCERGREEGTCVLLRVGSCPWRMERPGAGKKWRKDNMLGVKFISE